MVDFGPYKNRRNKIQREIKRFRPEDIVFACISYLNSLDIDDFETLSLYQPWFLLLLIKWTIIHGYSVPLVYRYDLTELDLRQLINSLNSLGGLTRLPNEYSHSSLWLRNIAFQQFWYRERITYVRIARQSLLFGKLEAQHRFSRDFLSITGLSINDFILLSMYLLYYFISETPKKYLITIESFTPIREAFSLEKINLFLTAISLDMLAARSYLKEVIKSTNDPNPYNEFYEQTPFIRYPLLKFQQRFFAYSPTVLVSNLQSFISDTLRNFNPDSFMPTFGGIFERYVEKAIQYMGLSYTGEATLRREFGQSSKLIDFIVVEKGINILIDAKGVELGYLGMVSQSPNIILDKTESSILKAIEQGYAVSQEIAQRSMIGELKVGSKANFLIVVTFKDHYVGNGKDFYDAIAQTKVDEIVAKYGGTYLIPLEHMYFMSIDDLDLLASYSKDENRGIADLLSMAVRNDQEFDTKKFVFRQHILATGVSINQPVYLKEEADKIFEKLIEGFKS